MNEQEEPRREFGYINPPDGVLLMREGLDCQIAKWVDSRLQANPGASAYEENMMALGEEVSHALNRFFLATGRIVDEARVQWWDDGA